MGFLNLPLTPMEGGGGYQAPSVEDFKFDGGFIPGLDWVNKPLVQAVIAALVVILLWWLASRKLSIVPSRGQFLAEQLYDLVRNGIARDALGHDFRRYTPYLVALFSFILLNNWFGELFVFMFPTFSNIGYAYGLALLTFIIYNAAGIARKGFFGYLKAMTIPAGVPWWLLWLIIPLEVISNFIVRPLTLALRLFANMFAGHLVIMVFVVGGAYLLTQAHNPIHRVAGGVSFVFSFAIFALELMVGALQAYVFTVLTAQYVASSTADEH